MPAPDLVDHWSYSTQMILDCSIDVDPFKVRSDCQLPGKARIGAVAVWAATSTNLRCASEVLVIESTGKHKLEFSIAAGLAGGVLAVERRVVLLDPVTTRSPLTPSRAGSILWQEPRKDTLKLVLEGTSPRFPTEFTDFEMGRIGEPGSIWWLHLDLSDLDSSALSAVRLYLNSKSEAARRIDSGADDEEARAFRSALEWDVARQMILRAISMDEFRSGWGSFVPTSIGEVIETLILRLFPGQDSASLFSILESSPDVLEARLQGRVGLFAGAR